ncbi:hypothetical protein CPC08DRAFT_716251 [Agrocybe pediades]|nr:hypothetical protein CPC08DRAFT_716251 [Agrocybe pediades]
MSERARMGNVHALIGTSPSHLILIREVRTAGDDVQDEMFGISLSVLAEKEQTSTPGNRRLLAEDGLGGGEQMNHIRSE